MKATKFIVTILFLALAAVSFAQNFPPINEKIVFHRDDFKTVDKLLENGLSNKAILKLLDIQAKSIQEKNLYNLNRSLERIIESSYSAGLEPKELQGLFFKQHELFTKVKGPMQNIFALNLEIWFQNIHYRNVFSFDAESLEWKINGDIIRLKNYNAIPLKEEYQRLFLGNELDLMQIASEQIFETAGWKYKPTLYDVMAEKYLNSLSSQQINDSCYWESTLDFTQENLSNGNRIYANLEQLHQTNQRWDTYAYWLDNRIKNCDNRQLTSENLLPVFERFQKELIGFSASNRFAFRQAQIHAEKASQFDWHTAKTEELGFEIALRIIEEAFSVHPQSEFNDELVELKKQILAPSLDLVFDNDIRPSKYNFMNVKFRNLTDADMIIFKIKGEIEEGNYTENPLKKLKLEEIGIHQIKLFDDSRHLYHNKDFLLNELTEPGQYLVMVGENWQLCRSALTAERLHGIENLAFEIFSLTNLVLRKSNEKDGLRLLVNNIENGKPIKRAKVIVDQVDVKTRLLSHKEYKTDNNGSVKLNGSRRSEVTVYHKGDSISDYLYFYPKNSNQPTLRTVFTDRSLYRPGQSVFYKTLIYSEKESIYQSDSAKITKILFKDVNGQTLYENTAKTNEYGSTSGSFVLPKSGIPFGGISIFLDDSYAENIQVEEYKRPTFTVSFEAPKEKIVLGETVKMEGKVTAFAGYPIVNAEVEITISEVRYFPRRCIVLAENRIYDTTLVVKTDDKGIFKIEFEPNNQEETSSVFYSFDAVIIDLTGETQSANYSMFIGKSALSISATIQGEYRVDEQAMVTCTAENSQGIIQEGKLIQYEIRKKNKSNWYRKTRVEAEFKDFSEHDLKVLKPDLAYYKKDGESKYSTIYIGEILNGNQLDLQSFLDERVGEFEIYFSLKDEVGDSAELTKKFIVWNPKSKKDQHQEEFWMEVLNKNPNLGDKVEVYVGTSHKNAKLFVATYNEKGLISLDYKRIIKRRTVTIDMDESVRNGVAVYASIIKKGEISEGSTQLFPVDSSRILKMKFKSIHEPLRPGSEQNWVMEVTQKGNKVTNAELLTSMYDASLDEILGHSWQQGLTPRKYIIANWSRSYFQSTLQEGTTWPNQYFFISRYNLAYRDDGLYEDQPIMMKSNMGGLESHAPVFDAMEESAEQTNESTVGNGREVKEVKSNKIRENFNETAFFFPQIHANENGDYQWSFTLPDALTRWKMMALVHTEDLKNTFLTQTFEARKELMLETFEPRFWRKGDSMVWVGKVTNLSEKEQIVDAKLKFTNSMTEEDISSIFGDFPLKQITLAPNESKTIEWSMFIPENAPILVNYEAEASTEDFADIVRKPTPVLSGMETVTMADNFTFNEKGTFDMKLQDLEKISNNAKLISYSLQVQPQPLWGTMLSLAKLMEPTNELTESYFTQYFATQLAQKILNENPEMKRTLKTWQLADEDAMTSLLEQNEELKSLVLSETLWFEDAKSETQNLRRLSQLLDEANLFKVSQGSWEQLKKLNLSDGTWSWIGKERSNWYITQHIVNGLAWLKQSKIEVDEEIFSRTLNTLDNHYHQQYAKLTKMDREKELGLSASLIQWLYIRSFTGNKEDSATLYYAKLITKQWKNYSLFTQAIMGLWSLRKDDVDFANKLKASLNDKARKDKNRGMYWLENLCGYGWYENNIETHSMLIQFLEKAGQSPNEVRAMQMWLLQQKRTQMWDSPKSTAMACYALQSFGNESPKTQKVTLRLPNEEALIIPNEKVVYTFMPSNQNWSGVKQNATIDLTADAPVFANMQVTYLDKAANIQKTTGDFRVERIYYLVKNGEEIAISTKDEMEIGNVIRVKIKLVSDRSLDFVYIEDPKAPGWEPMNTLSGYQYTDGMYYLSNRDSKTEFFIENVNKGTHTYVYDVKVTAKGVFHVGPSKAMCYYAPTFVANTHGKEMKVK
jgi:hypothetical protein